MPLTLLVSRLFAEHQGWVLTGLSSLMCILGASIIYLDLLIKVFWPNSKFDIKSNEKFLISGFSISCGSLLLTSLYRLLPTAYGYFDSVEESFFSSDSNILIYFSSGVLICGMLNQVIHRYTSESIIHCNHGGDDIEPQEHSHSHSPSNTSAEEEEEGKPHSHRHSHRHSHSHGHIEEISRINGYGSLDNHSSSENECIIDEVPENITHAVAPLTTSTSDDSEVVTMKKNSLLGFLDRIRGQNQCVGIEDEHCIGYPCIDDTLTNKLGYDIHNLEFYRDLNGIKSKSSLVAYTHHTEGTPLLPNSPSLPLITSRPSTLKLANEVDLNLHSSHKDDHHHTINTPVSRLLSIGLQTCLALTLHKFPEGFITYATSKADPKLGLSIFLSLAIHNIIEGFSMTLPLYLSLNSRMKAFGITFLLGGLSQPIGALLAYYSLRGKTIDSNNSFYVFGALIAITSGFLTVVSLQLFASAINFGGSTRRVISWCFIGMFIIQLSLALTGVSD